MENANFSVDPKEAGDAPHIYSLHFFMPMRYGCHVM